MPDDWTQAVQSNYAGGDARFDFPARPLGWGKLMGLFLIGFSVLFDWGAVHSLWHDDFKFHRGTEGAFDIFFSLFELAFALAGLVPAIIGLGIIFGRSRVEWKDGQLRSTEILGPLRWTRRLPRKPVARLEVAAAKRTGGAGQASPQPLENFSSLGVEFADGTKKILLAGYPKDWLVGVAEKLRGCAGQGASAGRMTAPVVQVVDSFIQNSNDQEVFSPPAGSRVQVETTGNGLRLVVPPAGLWRGSKGFVIMPIMWCGFVGLVTVLTFLPGTKRQEPVGSILLMLLPFWAVGLALLAFVVNLGRRRAEMVVVGNRLTITTKGLFGTKEKSWTRPELATIRADDSGMKYNDKSVIELQIHPLAGKKAGFLAGRDEQELRWLATRLRQALSVPARIV